MLYTVVPMAAKYQSKNVIDTAVYRGSDKALGWIQGLIGRLGVGLAGWGWIAAVLTVVLTAGGASGSDVATAPRREITAAVKLMLNLPINMNDCT